MSYLDDSVHPEQLVSASLLEIERISLALENTTSLTSTGRDQIDDLSKQLKNIEQTLPLIFTLDVPKDRINQQLLLLRDSKSIFPTITRTGKKIESALCHQLDILEQGISTLDGDQDFDKLFDQIENCTQMAVKMESWIRSRKGILDASLEFSEILVDHIEALESVIEKNIELCFEIQEERFSSPVRHTPSFTLKQLVGLLSSNSENSEVKVPIFSNMEEALCRKFLTLKRSIPPIEKSLKEILPERIAEFSNRNVSNMEFMSSLLQDRAKNLSTKYRFMVSEIRELKSELIDKRWTTLFRNLNHELSSILEEVQMLQHKIANNDYSYSREIDQKFTKQLQKKTKTITKTFNVIYRALEFSLLEAEVASETNTLAQKWLDIRPVSDKLLSDSRCDEADIQSLTQQLRDLKVKSSTPSAEGPGPQRNNFGALLMKKMNIKPVIIKGTPQSAVKVNPFYEKSPTKERNMPTEGLILKTAPLLPYSSQHSSAEDIFEAFETSSSPTSRSMESLESEKFQHYASRGSRIPTLPNTTLSLATIGTPRSKLTQHWTPYPTEGQFLHQPTPRAVLLSSGMM